MIIRCHCSQTFSVDRAGEYMYVCTHLHSYLSVYPYSLKTMQLHADTLMLIQHYRAHSGFSPLFTHRPPFKDVTTLTYMPSTCGSPTPRAFRLNYSGRQKGKLNDTFKLPLLTYYSEITKIMHNFFLISVHKKRLYLLRN